MTRSGLLAGDLGEIQISDHDSGGPHFPLLRLPVVRGVLRPEGLGHREGPVAGLATNSFFSVSFL